MCLDKATIRTGRFNGPFTLLEIIERNLLWIAFRHLFEALSTEVFENLLRSIKFSNVEFF